jgi:hypothetical protein
MQYTVDKTPDELKRLADEAGRFVDSRMGVSMINAGIKEGVHTPAVLRLKDNLERLKFRRKRRAVRALTRWEP